MAEAGAIQHVLQYGSYLLFAILGWFFRRHIERSDAKEQEQDKHIEILDKRIDSHDVSRADLRAQINSIHQILKKMDKNIDKLLDK